MEYRFVVKYDSDMTALFISLLHNHFNFNFQRGGIDAGVHARDSDGNFYTILESPVWKAETTGLTFSPDGIHMYFAYQANGLLYDVTREDGLPFHGRSINAKVHNHNLHNV